MEWQVKRNNRILNIFRDTYVLPEAGIWPMCYVYDTENPFISGEGETVAAALQDFDNVLECYNLENP